METIPLGTTGRTTTRLGFGCSSLMGALDRRESLALLEAAFDGGVRHFDTAPMYGFGQAESCLGEFLARHRADITVTTKYGIPPARNQGLVGLARSLARPVVKLMPGLKKSLSQLAATATQPTEKASFSPTQARESLTRSLAALKTGHIDVWLLHEVTADDLRNDDLLRLLEDEVAAGTIGTFGVGSDRDKIRTLAIKRPRFCRTMQFEWSILDAPVPATPAPAMEGFRFHHRALTDHFRALHAGLEKDKARCAAWSQTVGHDLANREVLASLMLKGALVENSASVILFSSRNPAHIRRNVEVAGDATLVAPAKALYSLVQQAAQNARRSEAGG